MARLSWTEGKYFDLWTLTHVLGPAILGLLFDFLHWDEPLVWIVGGVLIISWEVGEWMIGIQETVMNRVLDIIIGYVSLIGAFMIAQYIEGVFQFSLLGFFVIVLAVLNVFGWRSYKTRTKA